MIKVGKGYRICGLHKGVHWKHLMTLPGSEWWVSCKLASPPDAQSPFPGSLVHIASLFSYPFPGGCLSTISGALGLPSLPHGACLFFRKYTNLWPDRFWEAGFSSASTAPSFQPWVACQAASAANSPRQEAISPPSHPHVRGPLPASPRGPSCLEGTGMCPHPIPSLGVWDSKHTSHQRHLPLKSSFFFF